MGGNVLEDRLGLLGFHDSRLHTVCTCTPPRVCANRVGVGGAAFAVTFPLRAGVATCPTPFTPLLASAGGPGFVPPPPKYTLGTTSAIQIGILCTTSLTSTWAAIRFFVLQVARPDRPNGSIFTPLRLHMQGGWW